MTLQEPAQDARVRLHHLQRHARRSPTSGFKDGKPVLDFTRGRRADEDWPRSWASWPVVSYGGGVTGLNAYYQDTDADEGRRVQGLQRVHQGHLHRGPEARRREGLAAGLLQPGRRADRRRPDAARPRTPRPTARRFPRARRSSPAASSFTRQRPRTTRTSASPRPCTWPTGTATTRTSVKLLHEAGSDWAFYNGGNRWTFGDYMYKAAKQFGMKFRLSWHWNAAAGDPYYALDCREDDYAWCNAIARRAADPGRRVRAAPRGARRLPPPADAGPPGQGEGRHAGRPGRREARSATAWPAFKLGQRDHDALFGPDDWNDFRRKLNDAIESLRQ